MNRPPRSGGTRLATRFLLSYAVTYLLLIGALGLLVDMQVRSALVDDVFSGMEAAARVARLELPETPADIDPWASTVFSASGMRVTVIADDGVVLGDSHSDPEVMENHRDRPEVITALGGEVGRASRVSSSTGFAQYYVALPPDGGGPILRVSVSEATVGERLLPFRLGIVSAFTLIGLIGVGAVAFLGRRLAQPIGEIKDTTLEIAGGDLGRRPRRSSVRELDDLGLAISQLADELGERLTQSELANQTLEVVLGALPQGTILVGAQESIVYSNPRAVQLLGNIPPTLGELTPHRFQTVVREAAETGAQRDAVVDHGSPPRRLRGVATPFAADGRVLLVVVDVTEGERVASIRRDFVANASHELKTPVASIIAATEALTISVKRGDGSAERFAATAEAAARQLDRLVSDLLDLSRLEREEPELERVRLDRIVSEEAAAFAMQAREAGIDLEVQSEEMWVMGNQRDLAMAVRNLLDNAVRYTREGRVSVRGRVVGELAVVEVEDTGAGIPTRDLERVFERFYRVDAARSRRTGGTGLGLSIVKHIVESHGGSVTATSQLDVGSTFTVRLPAA